jgi:hypothetical protein
MVCYFTFWPLITWLDRRPNAIPLRFLIDAETFFLHKHSDIITSIHAFHATRGRLSKLCNKFRYWVLSRFSAPIMLVDTKQMQVRHAKPS